MKINNWVVTTYTGGTPWIATTTGINYSYYPQRWCDHCQQYITDSWCACCNQWYHHCQPKCHCHHHNHHYIWNNHQHNEHREYDWRPVVIEE